MVPKKKSSSVPFKPDSSLLCGKPFFVCVCVWPNGKRPIRNFLLSKPTNVNLIVTVIQPSSRNIAWFMFGKESHIDISAWKPVTSYKAKMLKTSNLAHSLRNTLLPLAYRIV